MNLLKKIFLPSGIKKESLLSNKDLLSELHDCFLWNLENESLGTRMLYPMAFNIILHPHDFESRKPALPFVVQEVVNVFYEQIRKKQSQFPNYEPTARHWSFQFSPASQLVLEEVIEIEKGKPFILAELYTKSISNVSLNLNSRVSMKPQNSNSYSTFNINPEVIKNFDVVAEGVFTFPFDKTLAGLKEAPRHAGEAYAVLSYNRGSHRVDFSMIDKEIYISGNKDRRKVSWVMIIDADELVNNHVAIRFNGNVFEVAAFGMLRVNERKIPVSEGGKVQWYPLSKKAKLLINNFIPVDFNSAL